MLVIVCVAGEAHASQHFVISNVFELASVAAVSISMCVWFAVEVRTVHNCAIRKFFEMTDHASFAICANLF